ncbi:MAG: Fic family protein [archaeon]
MKLDVKKVNNKIYYYLELKFRVLDKQVHFSKYIGLKKPSSNELKKLILTFYDNVIYKVSQEHYTSNLYNLEDVIKTIILRNFFIKKYNTLSPIKQKQFKIDSIILFTLTTLTTEDVDINIQDVKNAYKNKSNLSREEIICKNMIDAVNLVSNSNIELTIDFLKKLHRTTMAEFETKTPGMFRVRPVHLIQTDQKHPLGRELNYQPPNYIDITKQLINFVDWYNTTELNPLEKAVISHYKLYMIHPFLDGNKRICRLIFNKVLVDSNFPMLNISDKKGEYFKSLISAVEKNNPKEFAEFSYKQYLGQVKYFINK